MAEEMRHDLMVLSVDLLLVPDYRQPVLRRDELVGPVEADIRDGLLVLL